LDAPDSTCETSIPSSLKKGNCRANARMHYGEYRSGSVNGLAVD